MFSPPAGPVEVVCLETSLETSARSAFDSLVASRLEPSCALVDAKVFAPSAERWKVSDLDPLFHHFTLAPLQRKMALVLAADVMEPSVYDRLLKLVEEPDSPSTIVLAAPQASQLPTTLRSRLTFTMSARSPLPPSTVDVLGGLNLPPTLYHRTEFHDTMALLLDYPNSPSLAPIFSQFDTPALAVARLASFGDALASHHGLNSSAVKRFRPRWLAFVLAISEEFLLKYPPAVLVGLLPAHAATLAAFRRNVAPLPHLTNWFVAVSESLGGLPAAEA